MEKLPHEYVVSVRGDEGGDVALSSPGLPDLTAGSPVQFGGPGGQWSPETLLMAAAGGCFTLTFRAVAAASKLPFASLRCEARGRLDRVDGVTRFTGIDLRAHLTVPAGTDVEKARRLLEKSRSACLITNSLALEETLTCEIETASAAA